MKLIITLIFSYSIFSAPIASSNNTLLEDPANSTQENKLDSNALNLEDSSRFGGYPYAYPFY